MDYDWAYWDVIYSKANIHKEIHIHVQTVKHRHLCETEQPLDRTNP